MTEISIIISSFNAAPFLAAAAESALGQTRRCQVIAVDNGSEDESISILSNFGGRIEVVEQENLGEAGAIHTGLSRAKGDMIIVLDADDLLYPHCVESVVKFTKPGQSKIQYRLDTVGPNGEDRRIQFPHYPPGYTPSIVRRMNIEQGGYLYPITCGNAYSRAFLAKILPVPDARFVFNADGYINRLAPLYGDVESIDCVLGAYRVHGRNLWIRDDKSQMWAKYLQDELDRQAEFEVHAARLDIAVSADAPLRNVRHLEVRLLSLRFAAACHPAPADRRALLMRRSLTAAWHTCGLTPVARLAWAGYLTFVALSPLALLRRVLPAWRGISARSRFARVLLSASRQMLPHALLLGRKQRAMPSSPSGPAVLSNDTGRTF